MPPLAPGLPALLIAHPGHELRVHGWLERCRPVVFVMTDGSGHDGDSRLPSTQRVLARAGASAGCVFGRFTDADVYAAILERRHDVFTGVADEIADALIGQGVTHLVADAAEGYNPTHDLCRYIADVAALRAGLSRDVDSGNFEFDLVTAPSDRSNDGAITIDLDAAALARKLEAARGYPELTGEVDAALAQWGADAFRRESFRRVSPAIAWHDLVDAPPFYERHGEQRQREGTYERVVRYHEHVRPLRDALRGHALTPR